MGFNATTYLDQVQDHAIISVITRAEVLTGAGKTIMAGLLSFRNRDCV
jgi:hypothetical protein